MNLLDYIAALDAAFDSQPDQPQERCGRCGGVGVISWSNGKVGGTNPCPDCQPDPSPQPEGEEEADWLQEAKGCLGGIGGFYDGEGGRDDRDIRALAAATFAQIAIAQELRGIREALEDVIETKVMPVTNRVERKVRVTDA